MVDCGIDSGLRFYCLVRWEGPRSRESRNPRESSCNGGVWSPGTGDRYREEWANRQRKGTTASVPLKGRQLGWQEQGWAPA